jgi:hypothetical protein
MKQDKFLKQLQRMLLKLGSTLWPLWWAVLPFLYFYVNQNSIFIPWAELTF